MTGGAARDNDKENDMSTMADLPTILGDAFPASDLLVIQLAQATADYRDHSHPAEGTGPDLYCLNLTSFMGSRMVHVLRRLVDAEAEVAKWKDRHTALAEEAAGYLDRIGELEADFGGES